MEGEELENRRKRRAEVKRKMIILSVLLCGCLAVLLWLMLRFPRKIGIKMMSKNCTDDMRICPPAWDLISQKCFFQSEHETTWVEGQRHCRKYLASLAKIVSWNDMELLADYLNSSSSYWIGLRKHNVDNIWRWMDGSHFSNWFSITDSSNCALVDVSGPSTTSCNGTRKYLCSKKSHCV